MSEGGALLKFRLSQDLRRRAIVPAVFIGTGLLCLALSIWTANAIERFSKLTVRRALGDAGLGWANVEGDGLQVILSGTAPTEAMHLRALVVAGNVVDSGRLRDHINVESGRASVLPELSIQILRNSDGISVIGLVPAESDREGLLGALEALAPGAVTDMLETSDQPVPEGWADEVEFAQAAVAALPQSKISVDSAGVQVTALVPDEAERDELTSSLRRRAASGLNLTLDLTTPRPVISPFAVRFQIDAQGARLDECAADSDEARNAILKAAIAAGAPSDSDCVIGLGVPTPDWAKAVTTGIETLGALGNGSVTFADTDVFLTADPTVKQADLDRAVGELESNLPAGFSLDAKIAARAGAVGVPEFVAVRATDGKVDLSGRLADELSRQTVESYAALRFGTANVHAATRVSQGLPKGWPARVLAALEVLATLEQGKVTVQPDKFVVEGVTGSRATSGQIARLLDRRLGEGRNYDLKVRYEKALDPRANLPTPALCVTRVNEVLAAKKISFQPGSALIDPGSGPTLDKVAGLLKQCTDYRMEVSGHTDSQGREEMNMILSQQRAQSVIDALLARRLLTGNLQARGYGETEPIMANDTEEHREQNRRIEFRLIGADGKAIPIGQEVQPGAGASQDAGSAAAADGTDADANAAGQTDGAADAGTDAAAPGEDAGPVEVLSPDKTTIRPKPRPDDLAAPAP